MTALEFLKWKPRLYSLNAREAFDAAKIANASAAKPKLATFHAWLLAAAISSRRGFNHYFSAARNAELVCPRLPGTL